jgi:inner membrane protein
MKGKTHMAAGILVSIPLLTVSDPIAILGIAGSIAPDLDIKLLGQKYHRTITHSLIALAATTMPTNFISERISIVWCASYISHLFLDSLTVKGVPLFYPFSKKYYGLKLINTNTAIGKTIDSILEYSFYIAILFFLGEKAEIWSRLQTILETIRVIR